MVCDGEGIQWLEKLRIIPAQLPTEAGIEACLDNCQFSYRVEINATFDIIMNLTSFKDFSIYRISRPFFEIVGST